MRRKSHSRQKRNINIRQESRENYSAENVIVFSPTTNRSSEKKENAHTDHTYKEKIKHSEKKTKHVQSNKDPNNTSKLNDSINKLFNTLDNILTDDLILIALIAILIFERNKLKKTGADKNEISDYDYMIAALIYIFI